MGEVLVSIIMRIAGENKLGMPQIPQKSTLRQSLRHTSPAGPIKMATPFGVAIFMERLMGVEPTYAAWEAAVLPMNYSCIWKSRTIIPDLFPFCKLKIVGCMKPPRRT